MSKTIKILGGRPFSFGQIHKELMSFPVVRDPNRILHLQTGSRGSALIERMFRIEACKLTLTDSPQDKKILDMLNSEKEADQDLAVALIHERVELKKDIKSTMKKLLWKK
jgi:hypothetical protein